MDAGLMVSGIVFALGAIAFLVAAWWFNRSTDRKIDEYSQHIREECESYRMYMDAQIQRFRNEAEKIIRRRRARIYG